MTRCLRRPLAASHEFIQRGTFSVFAFLLCWGSEDAPHVARPDLQRGTADQPRRARYFFIRDLCDDSADRPGIGVPIRNVLDEPRGDRHPHLGGSAPRSSGGLPCCNCWRWSGWARPWSPEPSPPSANARTIEYLFASRLSNAEIVLGKLAAQILHIVYLVLAGVPILTLMMLLGGIAPEAVLALDDHHPLHRVDDFDVVDRHFRLVGPGTGSGDADLPVAVRAAGAPRSAGGFSADNAPLQLHRVGERTTSRGQSLRDDDLDHRGSEQFVACRGVRHALGVRP